MKALILSGGKGTRLRPITHSMAKQLVPVANKPTLFYGLEAMRDAGVREVGIIVGDTADEIKRAVDDGSQWGLCVTYIHQPQPLGLAHAVLTAEPYLQGSPFVMYLGDNIVKHGVTEFVQEFERARPNALILLAKVPNPQDFGVAELSGDQVVRLIEKPAQPKSDLALVGVYLFDSTIFQAARAISPSARGELEITDAIQWLIDNGKQVNAKQVTGWWKDTGSLEALLEANRLTLEDAEPLNEGQVVNSQLSGRVIVERGAQITDCVIRGPVCIGADSVLQGAFVGPFTAIGRRCRLINAEIEFSIVLDDSHLENLSARIENSLIGQGVQVKGGSRPSRTLQLMLGDHSAITFP
ncbi:MAG: glucose-1-phosphate thymidylyltransferase [Armatimonadetes bacterium]|nr:glucose-1-phosphate thymidylyltransferase [Armatimonadota bacterium]